MQLESVEETQAVHKQSFWKGIAAGFLAGITVAAALRLTPLEKYLSRMSVLEGKVDEGLASLEDRMTPDAAEPQVEVPALRTYPRSLDTGSAG